MFAVQINTERLRCAELQRLFRELSLQSALSGESARTVVEDCEYCAINGRAVL